MYYSHFINFYFSGKATAAVIPSTSSVFGSGFGKSESKAEVSVSLASSGMPANIFATASQTTLFNAPSQVSTPAFDLAFNKNAALTSLNAPLSSTSSSSNLLYLGEAAKQPPSTSLTFGGFSNLGSAASTQASSSSSFDDANRNEITGDNAGAPLTFGSLPRPPFEVKSSNSKPLFPITSQSSSMFGTGNANKPQTGTTGVFGRAFAAATAGQRAKEKKEKVAEEKIRGLDTSNLTALVIKNIPDAYNKNAWLKRFYSRFGEVTKVLCSAAKMSASVVFKTHVSKVPCH